MENEDLVEMNSDDHKIAESTKQGPKYFRVLSIYNSDTICNDFHALFGCHCVRASIPKFYSFPGQIRAIDISRSSLGHKIQFIDITSGYCVESMTITPGQRILELCCAPGGKLIMIAENFSTTAQLLVPIYLCVVYTFVVRS